MDMHSRLSDLVFNINIRLISSLEKCFLDKKVLDYKYYILEPGIFVLVDGTNQTEYTLFGQRIVSADGKTYQRLSSFYFP